MANQLTPDQLMNALAQLTVAVGNLTQQVADVATHVTTVTATIAQSKESVTVEKPTPFTGKHSEEARRFRAMFNVWINSRVSAFQKRDANGKLQWQTDAQT